MNSFNRNVFLLLSVGILLAGSFRPPKKQRTAGIVFYNVENLFDTLDNKLTNDDEFLPAGNKTWNTQRYFAKLERIADVLNSSAEELPYFVGFAEIENRSALEDLASVKQLSSAKYQIVHFNSPDERGIDVGFFYSKKKVKNVQAKSVHVNTGAENRPTRDILLVKCRLKRGPDVYFFVNHWPSRYGGQKKTEPKRIAAAKALRNQIDSLFLLDANSHIIIMGDFNDYPHNKSIDSILISMRNSRLLNLMPMAKSEYSGSYSYKGEWGYLDQFIVSKSLADTLLPEIKSGSIKAFSKPEMIHTTRSGNKVPNRTYGGTNYYSGFSDHLPIYMEIEY